MQVIRQTAIEICQLLRTAKQILYVERGNSKPVLKLIAVRGQILNQTTP